MGFFQRLFRNKQKKQASKPVSLELERIFELDALMSSLLSADHYVARSEYSEALSKYDDLSAWFKVLRDSGTLDVFCRRVIRNVGSFRKQERGATFEEVYSQYFEWKYGDRRHF